MALRIGSATPSKLYLGATEVTKAYLGANVAYEVGGGAAWTPAELGASLALWLDADDASTITLNGSTVSQWDDKSGNGRNATQAVAANQPTYNLTGFNGKPAVVWPNVSSAVRMDIQPFAAQSFFFVVRYHDGTRATWISGYQTLLSLPSSTGATGSLGLLGNASGSQWLNNNLFLNGRYNGGAQVNLNDRVTLPLPNTVLEASAASAQTPIYSWQFGCDRNVTGRAWSGPMAEIIATPTLLSTADRQKLEGYLAHKWGLTANLPADHPYKSTPPTV